jgi:hypothetical protein
MGVLIFVSLSKEIVRGSQVASIRVETVQSLSCWSQCFLKRLVLRSVVDHAPVFLQMLVMARISLGKEVEPTTKGLVPLLLIESP